MYHTRLEEDYILRGLMDGKMPKSRQEEITYRQMSLFEDGFLQKGGTANG